MSEGTLLHGKRGQGKTLYAVDKMRQYLREGRMIATNIDLNLEHMVSVDNRMCPFRLPDHPELRDFEMLGDGNPDPTNEDKNGLLVLDECAGFLNSRSWNDKKDERLKVIAWLAQSRKHGWDLILIAQAVTMLDAQIREGLLERSGTAVNLRNMHIPVITGVGQALGLKLRFPKLHRINVRMGFHPKAPLMERWVTTGKDIYPCYDTLQRISPLVGVKTGEGYQLLSRWHTTGRYQTWWQTMKKPILGALIFGLCTGGMAVQAAHLLIPEKKPVSKSARATIGLEKKQYGTAAVRGQYQVNGKWHLVLSDGRDVRVDAIFTAASGAQEYRAGDEW
jgi:hypothetical protein